MSDYKQIQKQMKGPDEFQVKVFTWIDHLAKYKLTVIGVVGAVTLILLGAWGFRSYMDGRTSKRRLVLADVDMLHEKEMEAGNKSREGLQKSLDALTAETQKPDMDPAKKIASELQIKSLQDQIKAIKPDHAGSREQYKAVYEQFKQNQEGWLAGLRYASFLVKDKKLDESKAILVDILKQSKDQPFFQLQCGMLYLGVLEDLKDYDTALAESDRLLKVVPGDLKAKLLLTKGRLQMAKQQSSEAKATFDTVIKDYGTSPEAERARGMKAIIN